MPYPLGRGVPQPVSGEGKQNKKTNLIVLFTPYFGMHRCALCCSF